MTAHHPEAIDRDQPGTVQDYVDALTKTTTHHERYTIRTTNHDGTSTWITGRHRTTSQPLIHQLEAAIYTTTAESGTRAGFESKPSARIDALDALTRIEAGTLDWLKRLGLKSPVTLTPAGPIFDLCQALQRAAANAGPAILRDVRSWWITARTITGWDSPAWRPRSSCPLCAKTGGLRIRLDAQTGHCLECGEVWDHTTIGLLADHIRSENHEADTRTADQLEPDPDTPYSQDVG
jgi:hypothetical protein